MPSQVHRDWQSMGRVEYAVNPRARSEPFPVGLFSESEYELVHIFFRDQKTFPPTPLWRLRALAAKLNVGEILVKDESSRFGVSAFKLLGVQYAVERLNQAGRLRGKPRLVCATDGNHGRAVAHVARQYGCSARVYMPGYTVPARIRAIEEEGAEVTVMDSGYDEAVREAARCAEREGAILVSDTAWPGYEEIPRWIMAGYTQLINEASVQWLPESPPDLVLVQVGVGGLAGAIVSWLCRRCGSRRPIVIACEALQAACLLESFRVGSRVALEGSLPTIMAGLRCGEVSSLAWPVLAAAIDGFVAIDDSYALQAMRLLAEPFTGDPPIVAGESGACGLATLIAVLRNECVREVKDLVSLDSSSRVLIFNTEGATDPELYARAMAGASGLQDLPE